MLGVFSRGERERDVGARAPILKLIRKAHPLDGTRALDALRLIRHVVGSEVRQVASPLDMAVADGEVQLRAFRGVAVFCSGGGDVWSVNVAGLREPDPRKDSVLVWEAAVGWSTLGVSSARAASSDACPEVPGFSEQRWALDRTLSAPVTGRYFERGAYRFSDRAFRLRQGRGWHPLTEEAVVASTSHLAARRPLGVAVTVDWEGPGPLDGARSWVAWAPR